MVGRCSQMSPRRAPLLRSCSAFTVPFCATKTGLPWASKSRSTTSPATAMTAAFRCRRTRCGCGPAPHAARRSVAIRSTVSPDQHFINWQQDPYGNYVARWCSRSKTRELDFVVDLVADMTVINPVRLLRRAVRRSTFPSPTRRQLARELAPYLRAEPHGPALRGMGRAGARELLAQPMQQPSTSWSR